MDYRADSIALACLASALAATPLACGDSGERGSDTAVTSTAPTSPTSITTDPTATASASSTTEDPTSGLTTGSTGGPGSTGDPPTTGTTTDPLTGSSTTSPPCLGLECQIDPCGGDPKKTTVSGIVFAPEGTLPLYNVTVYVPGGALPPVVEGVSCDLCSAELPGDPIVATLTNTRGEFTLEGVPSGQDIPLVVRVGKWRREVVLPQVTACADNLAPYDLTRLPKNQSEGHLPKIALVTGGADPFECLLRKIGIDDVEFTPEGGPGRVNFYRGAGGASSFSPMLGGASFSNAAVLWDSLDNYKKYDMVLMACEASQNGGAKSAQMRQNLVDYAGLGGRIFLSHWHNIWIQGGPAPWPSTATFVSEPDLPNPTTGKIDTTFPKGQALADWMVHVGGSVVPGEMQIKEGQHTIDAVNPMTSTRWVYTEAPVTPTVQYYTFNAPVGVPDDQQCGRVVDSDIHVSSGDVIGQPFPNGCQTMTLSPQEKALVFMFFELSACLIPDDMDPIPG